MIILDTNVLSALMRAKLNPTVTAWLDAQPAETIWTTTVTLFEVHYGLNRMDAGRNQQALRQALTDVVRQDLNNRILDFGSGAARQAAEIASNLEAIGRRGEIRDLMIAGIASAHQATVATGNTKDFIHSGVPLVDPWRSEQPTP